MLEKFVGRLNITRLERTSLYKADYGVVKLLKQRRNIL